MIHARINDVSNRNITGFEVGNRADFDQRHGGDPLWVFVDYDIIKFRIVTSDFLTTPTLYYFDAQNNLQRQIPQSGQSGQVS